MTKTTTLILRDVDPEVAGLLKARATANGRGVEGELRSIVCDAAYSTNTDELERVELITTLNRFIDIATALRSHLTRTPR